MPTVKPVDPLAQATLTLPWPVSAALKLAVTGSYAPNARGVVEIEQFFDTDADTARLAVAVAASADPQASGNAAATTNFNSDVLFILVPH
jgi:hypothetical protein